MVGSGILPFTASGGGPLAHGARRAMESLPEEVDCYHIVIVVLLYIDVLFVLIK